MRFYDITFFAGDGDEISLSDGPKCHVDIANRKEWEATLRINSFNEGYYNPNIVIHMSKECLIQFKNSILWECERLRKEGLL